MRILHLIYKAVPLCCSFLFITCLLCVITLSVLSSFCLCVGPMYVFSLIYFRVCMLAEIHEFVAMSFIIIVLRGIFGFY